ncbi:MAG TPA: hypothetical protein VGW74_19780 [Propionibacteriaceae bacterium]|nr:hypothetical protein [Propionibacteriaceae bacterium]
MHTIPPGGTTESHTAVGDSTRSNGATHCRRVPFSNSTITDGRSWNPTARPSNTTSDGSDPDTALTATPGFGAINLEQNPTRSSCLCCFCHATRNSRTDATGSSRPGNNP